ncbi:unnamed protein product [Strongylus vulgaris]|uniref:Uncharacterized protein n=1 Tax=Strongylus vulgaris TaxID=40348 RepID=A0A3P7IJ13_STRVU|nr:unnamed protein product [Strongylus vulgaris]
MSDDLPQDIRKIIAAQSDSTNLPKSLILPVLPKIAASSARSGAVAKVKAESLSSSTSELSTLPRLTDGIENMGLITPSRTKPILVTGNYELKHTIIPDHALLGSARSTARDNGGGSIGADEFATKNDFDKTFVIRKEKPISEDSISQVDLKFATIPNSLPGVSSCQGHYVL